ncbi:MAG: YceI family protein [Bacteroidia bacterium]
MKRISILIIIFCVVFTGKNYSQIYIGDSARVSLFSKTGDGDIDGTNTICVPIMSMSSSEFDVCLMNNAFRFSKPLMKEHFNDDFMESDKYPKTVFTGKIIGVVDYLGDGNYDVTVKGIMNMHGVKKKITIPGVITVKGDAIFVYAKFNIKIADYKMKLPINSGSNTAATDNMDITITATMKPYKK